MFRTIARVGEVAVVLALRLTSLAQDWQTLDSFPVGYSDGVGAWGVAADATGGLYVVGNSNGQAVIRYSAGGDTNWVTRDDYVYPEESDPPLDSYNAVTIDRSGNVFAGGFGAKHSLPHWIVRRSQDHGLSWDTVDEFYTPPDPPMFDGAGGSVVSLASDEHGRLYGGGRLVYGGPSYNWWMVRGSPAGGTNWQAENSGFVAYGNGGWVACSGSKAYVASTYVGDSKTATIMESTNGGASWSTTIEWPGHGLAAIACDVEGNLYAIGDGWVVYRAAAGATNLTSLDVYQPAGAVESVFANAIAVDAAGDICVVGTVGSAPNGSSRWHWVARQYSAVTGQWSTTDELPESQGFSAPAAVTIDADGNIFVVGTLITTTGQHLWLVRKRAARPMLRITATGQLLSITWPVSTTAWTLEWADSSGTNAHWTASQAMPSVQDGQNMVTLDPTNRARFFRLNR